MRRLIACVVVALAVGTFSGAGVRAQDSKAALELAAVALGPTNVTSIRFVGRGTEYAFGQSYSAVSAWPAMKVTKFEAFINYETPAMRVDVDRTNPDGPPPVLGGGGLPLVEPQHQIRIVSGQHAWGAFNANPGPSGQVPPLVPAQASVQERLLQIWTTPHGVVRAAQGSAATVNGRVVTFSAAGTIVTATLGSDHLVQKVEWKTDMPMLGDTLNETTYSSYRDFGGVKFPTRIVQKQGGFPIADLVISEVVPNAKVAIDVPANVQQAGTTVPPPKVVTTKIAEGVFWLSGETHHSTVVEFKDYSLLFDAPVSQERALAVIDAAKQAIPGKPIKYVVSPHHHFDHSGGLRAVVAQGIPIVAHTNLKSYYEKLFAQPHTISPDALTTARKMPIVEAVDNKRAITDGTREFDLLFCQSTHADSNLIGYLPKEKILIESDLFSPQPGEVVSPAVVNPANQELLDCIGRWNLDVLSIVTTHQRRGTLAELRKATTRAASK